MTKWLDMKIVIFMIAVGLGYYSHFVAKFPRDAEKVAASLVAYAVLMALHYYIESYKERGAFFQSKSHQVSTQCDCL